jgi:hypothetical protein
MLQISSGNAKKRKEDQQKPQFRYSSGGVFDRRGGKSVSPRLGKGFSPVFFDGTEMFLVEFDQLRTIVDHRCSPIDSQFSIDPSEMSRDGPLTDVKAVGDLFVYLAFCSQGHDLELSLRKAYGNRMFFLFSLAAAIDDRKTLLIDPNKTGDIGLPVPHQRRLRLIIGRRKAFSADKKRHPVQDELTDIVPFLFVHFFIPKSGKGRLDLKRPILTTPLQSSPVKGSLITAFRMARANGGELFSRSVLNCRKQLRRNKGGGGITAG